MPHFLSKCHKTSTFLSILLMAIQNKESNIPERATKQKRSILTCIELNYINPLTSIYR